VATRLAAKVNAHAAVNATSIGNVVRVTAAVAGTPFNSSDTAVDNGAESNPSNDRSVNTSNVAGVTEVRATGSVRVTGGSAGASNRINSVKVGTIELMVSSVAWATSDDATASALRTEINNNTASTGYSATVSTDRVTITAAVGTGSTPNGLTVVSTTGGNVDTVDQNMSGGVTGVTAAAQTHDFEISGDFPDEDDTWTITIEGTTYSVDGSDAVGDSPTSPTAADTIIQPNVAAVAEVLATGSVEITGGSSSPSVNKVTQVTVNAVSLLAAPVNWITSHSATANALAVAINNNSHVSGYTATAGGAEVVIEAAPGTGDSPNGFVVVATVGGSVTVAVGDMAGGVDEVEAVAQIEEVVIDGSSFDADDLWSVTVDGTTYKATGKAAGTATLAFVAKKRVYFAAGSLLRYSSLNDASDVTTTTQPSIDAGFINISTDSEGAQRIVSLGLYNGQVAIFSRENIVIYNLDTDAEENIYVDTLENTGTIAPHSVVPYGNTDVFYLDDTGIRSIKSRQGYNAAYVSDIGSAIDGFVQDVIDEVGESVVTNAQAIIDPREGRYLLAIGERLLALSYFPDAKITAWSYLDLGFHIDVLVRSGRDVFLRSGDTIYRYGGPAGATYPDDGEFQPIAETPFMDARDPAAIKMLQGFDMACSGDWLVEVLVDPNDTANIIQVGTINRTTYNLGKVRLPGRTSHVAFRFTGTGAGAATISSMAIHYDGEKPAG
jgi:hypothetical protein